MNLDDLKVIRNEERRSRRLTQLKNSFYSEFKEYMDSLKKSDDPQKKDELENALQVADAIYDKRAAKITKLAALAAKGHMEEASLADAEAEVYDSVYKVFTYYRDRVLGQQESDAAVAPAIEPVLLNENRGTTFALPKQESDRVELDASSTKQSLKKGLALQHLIASDEEAENSADENQGPRGDESTLIREGGNMRYLRVRVLSDIPMFIGLDGENYKLGKGDSVLLPEGNARALCDRHVGIIVGDKLEDAKED
jgi:DNA replication initiation complex subunit (GINS family)